MRDGLIISLLALGLAGCSPQSNDANVSEAKRDAANATYLPEQNQWKPPVSASRSDRALMVKWFKLNEACVGGINVTPDDPVCVNRDKAGGKLEKRGWCWGWINKPSSESDFHRCSENGGPLDVDQSAMATSTEDASGSKPLLDLDGKQITKERLARITECQAAVRANLDDPSSGEFPDVQTDSNEFSASVLDADGKRIGEAFPMRAKNQYGALVKMVGFCSWVPDASGKLVMNIAKAS